MSCRPDWYLTREPAGKIVRGGLAPGPGHEGTQPGLCFFELGDDSRITRITDFWPDPYELPASRAHLVERY